MAPFEVGLSECYHPALHAPMVARAEADAIELVEVYARYGPLVLRRARAILRDPDEAKDAMQEVFVRVVERRSELGSEASALHWMYRVTTNLCLNRLRQRRLHPVLDDPEAILALVDGRAGASADRSAVIALLDGTDDVTRQIAIYCYLDEMSLEEVAGLVGYSRKTVAKKLDRFKAHARAKLGGAR